MQLGGCARLREEQELSEERREAQGGQQEPLRACRGHAAGMKEWAVADLGRVLGPEAGSRLHLLINVLLSRCAPELCMRWPKILTTNSRRFLTRNQRA